jgi:hypothetical protein
MKKLITILLTCLFSSSIIAGVGYDGPQTLQEYKARTLRRVAWAEKKVKKLGRIKAACFFNKFDETADVNDYVFAYVCNDGKNNHFVLANKIKKLVFTNYYNHPNHVIMRAAYRKNPNGTWVEYPNPIKKGKKKYVYIKMLPKYKICIGSGFSM